MTAARDADEIPPAVLEEFGSDRARPRVVRTYLPPWGLRRFKPPVLLTKAAAMRLRKEGVLEVELRWHRLRRYMSLVPGYRSVWGRRSTARAVAATQPSAEEASDRRDSAA